MFSLDNSHLPHLVPQRVRGDLQQARRFRLVPLVGGQSVADQLLLVFGQAFVQRFAG
jgi:hypothetical protein